jgi:hypothetical protein
VVAALPFPTLPSADSERRSRGRYLRTIVPLLSVALLLLQLIPSTAAAPVARAPLSELAGTPSTHAVLGPAGTGSSLSAASHASASIQHSSVGLCALGLTEWCPIGFAPPREAPAPLVTGPHSWTDVTPLPIPTTYPGSREGAAMTFDAATNSVLLYGGLGGEEVAPFGFVVFQDTWSFVKNVWTPLVLNTSCTPSSCPPPIVGGSLAYDAADHEAILFGGQFEASPSASLVASNYTWAFASGHWTNLTSSAGPAPPARELASMSYDSGDGYVLLFGGLSLSGTDLADTWSFQGGHWTNRTAMLKTAPEPRADAALADSPGGYLMLFGGENNGSVIQGDCTNNTPFLMWWYHAGKWSPAPQSINCIGEPRGHLPPYQAGQSPPCGRDGAALGWSPLNQRFVLFGGMGQTPSTVCVSNSTVIAFNDTWVYQGALGGGLYPQNWHNDTLAGAPSPRYDMAYASDYADGAFLVFGGITGFLSVTNQTWRYYEPLSAQLKGPFLIQASAIGFDQFTLYASGGTGALTYHFLPVKLLKTGRALTGTGSGCQAFNNGTTIPVGSSGVVLLPCSPDATAYNIFRLSVVVGDLGNGSAFAYANFTFTVNPPEKLYVYSQYSGIFYAGFDVNNIFGVYAQIGNVPVSTVTLTIGGTPYSISPTNSSGLWWNSTGINMGSISAWMSVSVVASSSDWSENATMALTIVDTPSWLQQIEGFAQVAQQIKPWGHGPYNESYAIILKVPLPIGKLFNFSLPVPLISGNYSLIPALEFDFNASSTGNVTLSGTLSLVPPGISLGAFNLNITITLAVAGTLSVIPEGGGNSTITWDSASITFGLTADFSASIPIYGFSFDLLGQTIKIGFNLDIDIAPAFALSILLAPTKNMSEDVGNGLGLAIVGLLGHFSLPLKVDLSFGIGIASVAIGGMLSVDMIFNIYPTFEISNIWVNGSAFVVATFICWSATWNFIGPGVIYHYIPAFLLPMLGPKGTPGSGYDNGSNATWSLSSRAYNGSGFDSYVWSPSGSTGAAISDIYPQAAPSAAPAYNGAYVFYSSDNVTLPVQKGLTVSGASLGSGSNALTAIPDAKDPGFVVTHPVAATLPDGNLYVLWQALPLNETGGSSPVGLKSLPLHGAEFYLGNQSWGPVRVFSSSGFAQSYGLDTNGTGRVVALLSSQILPTATSPESLVTYDLSSGAVLATGAVSGYSQVVSVRVVAGLALLRDLGNNYTLLRISPGAGYGTPLPINYLPPRGSALLGAEIVPGTPSTLLLHYRDTFGGTLVLSDALAGAPLGTLAVAGNVSDAHAIFSGGVYYVYVATPTGYVGWKWFLGVWTPLPQVASNGATEFGLSQNGGSLLLYAVVTAGNGTSAVRTLYFAEVPEALPLAAVPPSSNPSSGGSGGSSSSSGPNYALYLAIAAVAVAILLIALVVLRRRSEPAPSPPASQTPPPPPGG